MKKLVAVIALTAGISGFMGVAHAEQTVSVGYASTHAKYYGESEDMPGFNLKYRWEIPDSDWGVIGSFTWTSKSDSVGIIDSKLTYTSYTAGPTYRINDYISAYALAGVANGKLKLSIPGYYSEKGSDSSFAWGLGVQFNPISNVAIDASYIGTKFDDGYGEDIDAGTWMLGIGYRF